MGTAMQNLHQLLQMPFGCGEQNMVLFAPNVYVLDYLNKTGQLSEEVKSKAIGYLVSGELNGTFASALNFFRTCLACFCQMLTRYSLSLTQMVSSVRQGRLSHVFFSILCFLCIQAPRHFTHFSLLLNRTGMQCTDTR